MFHNDYHSSLSLSLSLSAITVSTIPLDWVQQVKGKQAERVLHLENQ